MQGLVSRLTYANVMATIAVFVALGGVGYAATQLPKNSVGSAQLKDAAVTPPKLSAAAKSSLRGPAGPAGPQGERGLPGQRGAAGPEGEPGVSGISGVAAGGDLSGTYPDPEVTFAHQAGSALEATRAGEATTAATAADAEKLGGTVPSGFLRYRLSRLVGFGSSDEFEAGCRIETVSTPGFRTEAGDYAIVLGDRPFLDTGLEANGAVQEAGLESVTFQICNPTQLLILGAGQVRVMVVD